VVADIPLSVKTSSLSRNMINTMNTYLPEAQFADESVSDLSDLNIPIQVDSLMEVVVLACMVPLQVHLADYTLAGVGQESLLGQHLNNQLAELSSQPGGQDSQPEGQGSQPEGQDSQPGGQGSQYVLEVLGMLLKDIQGDV